MICAVADLPTPRSRSGAKGISFVILPVYMNVRAAESGSSLKPRTACCAATKALVVFIVKSRVKSANGSERGSFASFIVTAPAKKNCI